METRTAKDLVGGIESCEKRKSVTFESPDEGPTKSRFCLGQTLLHVASFPPFNFLWRTFRYLYLTLTWILWDVCRLRTFFQISSSIIRSHCHDDFTKSEEKELYLTRSSSIDDIICAASMDDISSSKRSIMNHEVVFQASYGASTCVKGHGMSIEDVLLNQSGGGHSM